MKVLPPHLQAKLSGLLAARMHQRGAAAMAIYLPSDLGCWATAVGHDVEASPAAPAPLFLAYSLTKSLLAAVVLKLGEDGGIRLDMPVARWYPRLPQAAAITLRQLLNHTSGLPDYGGLPAYHAAIQQAPSRPWTCAEFAAQIYEHGLLFQPGGGWAYSNLGYMLLKDIIERVAGAPWETALAARVLHPLGLGCTRVATAIDDLRALVPAYSAAVGTDGRFHDIRQCYHPGWVAHGVVVSTPQDMAALYQGMFSGGSLSVQNVREMTTLVPVPGAHFRFGPSGYGLGLMGTTASPYGPLWGHNGSGPGFRASAFHAPEFPGGAATVCVMCALEDDEAAEGLVAEALALLAAEG